MLADAIAAERFRLSRDRVSLFWGFAFAPLITMLFSMAVDLFTRAVLHRTIPGETAYLANRAMGAVAGASGPFTALFLLIGAAAIFAGDYRWETWRLITPRNSRVNLLAAKLIVFAEAAARVVAEDIAADLQGGELKHPYEGAGNCYVEFGGGKVAKVEVNVFGGPKPVAELLGPSEEVRADKEEFAASRQRRWFGL